MDRTVEPLPNPESHSAVSLSDNMNESNIQQHQSSVNGNSHDLEHTSDLMMGFDNNHEINSSPYARSTEGTAYMSEQDLHGYITNVASSSNQETVSAMERHRSEPVPFLGSPVSNQVLQDSSMHASTSVTLPDFHATYLTATQSTIPTDRGLGNPASLDALLNGNGHYSTFLPNGADNTRPGTQTNGGLAIEEIHQAMDGGSGPNTMAALAAHALVPRGHDFSAQGQQHGLMDARSQASWYLRHRDDLWATYHGHGAPDVDFDRGYVVSRPMEEYQRQRLALYGRTSDFGFDPANYENQEQQPQLGYEHNALSQPPQQYHGQVFGFGPPSNILQEESQYLDPELSQQPAYGGSHLHQQAAPDVQPGTVTRRRVHSNQRQLQPASTPSNALVGPNHFQNTAGMILSHITGDDVTLRFGSLTEADNALAHVANPVNQSADRSVPRTPEEERGYVRQMVAAMQCDDFARDNPSMVNMWKKQKQNTDMIENAAWSLLSRALVAHHQSDALVPGARSARFQSFVQRIEAIVLALAQDKTISKHVSSPSYQDQLVDDPAGAQNRVQNNRKVNGGKKIVIEEGKRRIREAWDRENSSPLAEGNLRLGQRQITNGDDMMLFNDGDSMVVNVSDRPVLRRRTPRDENTRERTSDTPGASAQEQAKTPGSKRAAAKRTHTSKARKRKNDDESDSPYQPSGKRNTKKQPATKTRAKTEKPYHGKYPVVYDPELNTDIISSVPSPARSAHVPLHPPSSVGYQTSFQPTDYENPYHPTSFQSPDQVTDSREAYLAPLYHNDYTPQSPIPRPDSTPIKESYEDRMRAAGLGLIDRLPLPQHIFRNDVSFGHGSEPSRRLGGRNRVESTPSSLFGGPHQMDNRPLSLFGGPHRMENRRAPIIDPHLTGRNPLNPSQHLPELALPHAPNTVGNEFNPNEPEPEELYQSASLGHRRRRPRTKRDEFDDPI